MMPVNNVLLPPRLAKLRRDRRGYPIPYIVWRDKAGKPQFAVNDAKMIKRCLLHNRCGICGDKLLEEIFFVGGPAAALHPNGAYVDPPMHEECAKYALQVCPFIAVRSYKGYAPTYVYEKIEPRRKGTKIVADLEHQMDGKPDLFILRGCHGFVNMSTFEKPRLVPTNTTVLEYWKDGVQLDEGDPLIDAAIKKSIGAVDDMAEQRQNAPVRSPMLTSMAAFAPMIRR